MLYCDGGADASDDDALSEASWRELALLVQKGTLNAQGQVWRRGPSRRNSASCGLSCALF